MKKENVNISEDDAKRIIQLKLEAKIYEICGVRLFRKCVFALEKWIHKRDKGTNINYHIASMDDVAAKEFIKFLYYNGSIHARNIAYFCIFCVIRYSLYPCLHYLDLIPFALVIKDIYCVILQRYNYIQIHLRLRRLDELRKKRIAQKTQKVVSVLNCTSYDETVRQSDLQLIQKIRNSVESGESIVLSDEDREAYLRLSHILVKAKEHQ